MSQRKPDWQRLAINSTGWLLFLVGILIVILAHWISVNPLDEIVKEVGIALIGAGAVTAVVRWMLDNQVEHASIDAIQGAANGAAAAGSSTLVQALQQVNDTLQSQLRRRTAFDPIAVYMDRNRAYDRLEREVREILSRTQSYTSFGVSGQYVALRLRNADISGTCTIQVLMADPRQLHPRIFPNHEKIKARISACTDSLIRTAYSRGLNLALLFTTPVPALRFDIFSQVTVLYAYDDDHRPEKNYPDAAKFELGTQWDKTSRQMAQDASYMARGGWERSVGSYTIQETHPRKREVIAPDSEDLDDQISKLLVALDLPVLTTDQIRHFFDELEESKENEADDVDSALAPKL